MFLCRHHRPDHEESSDRLTSARSPTVQYSRFGTGSMREAGNESRLREEEGGSR
jgi:hypothetical protein